jgi:PST family polysaccharide transporter
MALARTIVYSVGATIVSVISSLVRNKIFAAYLSLNVFGVLALAQQSVSLIVTLFSFGFPLGVTTFVAALSGRTGEERTTAAARIVVLAMYSALVLAVVVAVAYLVDAPGLARIIVAQEAYVVPLTVLLFSAPLMLVQMTLVAIMEGQGMVRQIAVFKALPAVVLLPVIVALTSRYHLVGAAVGVLLSEATLVVLGIFLLRKALTWNRNAWDVRPIVSGVYKVAVLSFLIGALWFLADFVAKRYILMALGEAENGIVQSVGKITDLYPTIALAWLSLHLFPTISANAGDNKIVAATLQRTALVAVMLIVPITLVLFLLREEVLLLVYKREFTVGIQYFGAMLSVGVLKVFVWVIGIPLLPLGMKKKWFYSGIIMIGIYVAGVWLGMAAGVGIYALPAATLLGVVCQTTYVLFVYHRANIFFERVFWVQLTIYAAMTVIFSCAVLYPMSIVGAAALYLGTLHRFHLLSEFKTRFNDLKTKYAA